MQTRLQAAPGGWKRATTAAQRGPRQTRQARRTRPQIRRPRPSRQGIRALEPRGNAAASHLAPQAHPPMCRRARRPDLPLRKLSETPRQASRVQRQSTPRTQRRMPKAPLRSSPQRTQGEEPRDAPHPKVAAREDKPTDGLRGHFSSRRKLKLVGQYPPAPPSTTTSTVRAPVRRASDGASNVAR